MNLGVARRFPKRETMSAATPETCGVAIEVPASGSYPPRTQSRVWDGRIVDQMSSSSSQNRLPTPPGATTPIATPKFEYVAFIPRRSTAPTQSALACDAGKSQAGKLSLPAAMITAAPCAYA